jgi:hypothetical protein
MSDLFERLREMEAKSEERRALYARCEETFAAYRANWDGFMADRARFFQNCDNGIIGITQSVANLRRCHQELRRTIDSDLGCGHKKRAVEPQLHASADDSQTTLASGTVVSPVTIPVSGGPAHRSVDGGDARCDPVHELVGTLASFGANTQFDVLTGISPERVNRSGRMTRMKTTLRTLKSSQLPPPPITPRNGLDRACHELFSTCRRVRKEMADVVTRHALWLTSFKAQRLEDDNFCLKPE